MAASGRWGTYSTSRADVMELISEGIVSSMPLPDMEARG
jgi:hypothetical protein